jgi:hypothetical protein
MKMRWSIGLLAFAFLAVGCAGETVSESSPEEISDEVATLGEEPIVQEIQPAPAQAFPYQQSPIAANSSSLPVPNLIPPTTTPERLPQVSVGRTDPFANLPVSPNVSISRRPTPAAPATVPAAPSLLPPAPSVSTVPMQTLPTLPTLEAPPPSLGTGSLPLVAIPPMAPPQRLAETIEISGVVEVGGKTSVIVQVPNEMSSRYAAVGDYLANGKVLIKRVEMGMEPTVILEEDGVETIRYVGSGSSLAGLF